MSRKHGVIAAIHLSKQTGKYVASEIDSVYGKDKDKFFIDEIEDGRLRYLNREKGRKWAQSRGIYLPSESDLSAYGFKILFEYNLVKKQVCFTYKVALKPWQEEAHCG